MNYTHIVFDIDGTLIDTETAVMKALQETIFEIDGRKLSSDELKFSMGIPGEVALRQLGIHDTQAANRTWNRYFSNYFHTIKVFEGIKPLLEKLKKEGCHLGIITSKNKTEYEHDFLPFGLQGYFETVICVEDASQPKPSPEPLLKYLEIAGADKKEVIYIGDSVYDMQCASSAGVDSGLVLWSGASVKHIRATYYFNHPRDVSYMLESIKNPYNEMPWLKWIMELQFMAQAGITYSKNEYDLERFERLREMAAEMMSLTSGFPKEQVKDLFCNETGFQTPKLDTRAAIFRDNKILLVKETNGTWSLPGGWVDVHESIKSNTIKEVREEAGLEVVPVKLIAVQDRKFHNLPLYAYGVCKVFVWCEIVGGQFVPNHETVESAFFALNELPLLATEKNTVAQIAMCFEARNNPQWDTVFD